MLTTLLILGCVADDVPAPVTEAAPFIDPWEPVEVDYDRAATEASLLAAVETSIGLTSDPVFAAYEAVMGSASASCPYMLFDVEGYTTWVDSCSTPEGVQFSGYGYTESGFYDSVSYDSVAVSATITGGSSSFSASGYWGESFYEDPQVRFWGTYLEGQVLWDGPGPESWVTRGLRPSIEIERSRYGTLEFTFVAMRGAVDGLDAPMSTVEFIEVTLEDPFCIEPVGTISVRDDGGHWFDVAFDGDGCDGCGSVTHLGDEVGEACVDFSSWTSWEPTP